MRSSHELNSSAGGSHLSLWMWRARQQNRNSSVTLDKTNSCLNKTMSTTATSGSVIGNVPLSITTFLAKCRVSVVKRNFIDRKI